MPRERPLPLGSLLRGSNAPSAAPPVRETDAVVWRSRCLRPVSEYRAYPRACAEGEVCVDRACFQPRAGTDACTYVPCPSGWPCLGGLCRKPNENRDWESCQFRFARRLRSGLLRGADSKGSDRVDQWRAASCRPAIDW